MWTLIKRELQDQAVYILAAEIMSILMIGTMIYMAVLNEEIAAIGFAMAYGLTLATIFCLLGTSQMYTDRTHRISTFLATLAVTRTQILTARILTGFLVVLVSLVPVFITVTILLHLLYQPLAFYWRVIAEVFITMVLIGCGCHVAGLQVGWAGSKMKLLGGYVLFFALIVSIYFIKGCDYQSMAILFLILATLILRTWQKFLSVSL